MRHPSAARQLQRFEVGAIVQQRAMFETMKSVVEEDLWLTSKFRGFNLKNKIVGIIGYGVIGKQVSNMLKAFDANILVHDPYLKNYNNKVVYFYMINSLC